MTIARRALYSKCMPTSFVCVHIFFILQNEKHKNLSNLFLEVDTCGVTVSSNVLAMKYVFFRVCMCFFNVITLLFK